MNLLLRLSRGIDKMTEHVAVAAMLMIFVAVVISASNAVARKAFSISSNAFLEIQWYLFSGVFLLAAGYTFLKNAHVRIDFLSSRFSARARNIIDIIGILVVVVPLCVILIGMSMPLFIAAYQSGEMSPDAGGLIRWPVYMMLPLGMALLLLQCASELVKRAAFLFGRSDDPLQESNEGEEIVVPYLADREPRGEEVPNQREVP